MHTNEPRQDPLTDLGYETRDVHYRPLMKIFIWFLVFVVSNLVIGYVLLSSGIHFLGLNIDAMSPVYSGKQNLESTSRKIPSAPFPMVQSNIGTHVDIQSMRQEEEARLKQYAFADDAHSKAIIPVDKAMSLVASGVGIKTGNDVTAESKGNTTDQRKDAVPGVTTDPASPAKPVEKMPAPTAKP